MTRLRLLVLALALTGCLSPPPGWTVTGGTPAQQAQALQLLEAARVVAPGSLQGDGGVGIVGPYDLPFYCLSCAAGCAYFSDGRPVVVVLDQPDISAGALPHELAHIIRRSSDEQAADQLGAVILAEYRRAHP